ncbi:hypothetical protein [Bosea sp. (in: a-proteobacteria)]|uniref:hypothetical protein n=1 Tax=Bosea sp. (in: a-proteobacteria) TaxID=1871050 RepID=UPI00261C46E7|nr:hypothetical protein [Bosea sp. (in: a-proteobacteria)]MCO5091376.1 hypothetical protein [Bosea sp. (in: a-proteobacteria)]
MTQYERPQQIIEYCLKPLVLDENSPQAQESVKRLLHVIKTLQLAIGPKGPRAVDFSNMPAIVINEAAHGDDA